MPFLFLRTGFSGVLEHKVNERLVPFRLHLKEGVMGNGTTSLFHISSWTELGSAAAGDSFTLVAGGQCAEGEGVYFSEGAPRKTAAEGARLHGVAAVLVIHPASPDGWWRTKSGVVRKFGRPRTWHSDGKKVAVTVREVGFDFALGAPLLVCDFQFAD